MGSMPERSSPSRVRSAAPKSGAPLTAPGRSDGNIDATGGSGGKITKTRQCVAKQRLISDTPAVPRLCGAARRRSSSRCAFQPVSRPAGSPKFNHRGRRYAVPANGCLVPLTRWPHSKEIANGQSSRYRSASSSRRFKSLWGVQGEVFFPLTSTYHGCPTRDRMLRWKFPTAEGISWQ